LENNKMNIKYKIIEQINFTGSIEEHKEALHICKTKKYEIVKSKFTKTTFNITAQKDIE